MKHIAIVTGGFSSEKEIALKSATTIQDHLPQDKYKQTLIIIDESEWKVRLSNGNEVPVDQRDFSFEWNGEKQHFDAAYLMIHGTPGEDGKLQGYFDLIGLPYTGCSVMNASLTFNKWTCNTFLKQLGVSCAGSVVLRKGMEISPERILEVTGLPCFVKPNDGGSSFGVSKVKEKVDLIPAIEKAFAEGNEVIIEQFMAGTEVTCGVFRNGNEVVSLPITEIVSENEFFDYEAKYTGASQEITPARISAEHTEQIQRTTKEIYEAMGLRGLCRIDYIIQQDGPYVIEVNTIPGMSPESIIPQQVRAAGFDLGDVLDKVVQECFS